MPLPEAPMRGRRRAEDEAVAIGTPRLMPRWLGKTSNGGQRWSQEFRAGQIVPESGIYRITHDVLHAADEHEVTVIKGRRFPT